MTATDLIHTLVVCTQQAALLAVHEPKEAGVEFNISHQTVRSACRFENS